MAAVMAAVMLACGGAPTSGDDPTPPGPVAPPPIASIAITPTTASLVVGQSASISAVARDATGAVLSDRTLTWSSSAPAVATVNSSGAVSAVAPGASTITVSAEGQSAAAVITVVDGAMIGPAGGTVTLAGGAVVLTIPAGALPTPTPITAVPRAGAAPVVPTGWQLAGAFYDLGPDGLTFAQPVTVTMRFDAPSLPAWGMTGDLGILRQHGGQWSTLNNLQVNVAAGTVSGTTTGFSGFGVGANDPPITVSPATASVNDAHRTRQLRALVAPRGEGIPRPGPGVALRYRWRTDGQAGVLSGVTPNTWTTSDSASYIATDPALRQKTGRIDVVYVDVLLNPESLTNTALPQRVYTVQVPVDADLSLTYDITPSLPRIDAGTTGTLRLVPRDRQGVALSLGSNQSVTWQSTAEFGTLNVSTQGPGDLATFAAASQFSAPPPRVDRVIATVRETNTHNVRMLTGVQVAGTSLYRTEQITSTSIRGIDTTFVEVFVDYRVTLSPPQQTLRPSNTTALSVHLSPAYDGPGLKYRFRKTGGNGTLNVPTGVLTDTRQVSYQAAANGEGMDVISVEVVSVVAGTEVAQLGTAEARLTVEPLVLPQWRLTSFTQVGTCCWYNEIGDMRQNPGAWVLFAFPTTTPGTASWPTPGVYLQRNPATGGPVQWISGALTQPLAHTVNVSASAIEGAMTWTGDARSGSVTGKATYLETNGCLNRYLFTISATKAASQMSGTITGYVRSFSRPPGVPCSGAPDAAPILFTANFTAVLVP
jgi:hypothetical protein